MAELTKVRFDTDKGKKILVLDDLALKQLSTALSMVRVPLTDRRAILKGEQEAPPLLYERFRKLMEKRLGRSPVLAAEEGVLVEIKPGVRGRAKPLDVEKQIEVKRKRKHRDEKEGRTYSDVIPIAIGPAVGRRKGEPTSNIFAIGTHRGTKYIIEEISAPIPLPKKMPGTLTGKKRAQEAAVAPYRWQARVLSHPWTKAIRGGFKESKGLAGRYLVGDLTTHTFPIFEGKDGWKKAKEDVERAIDRSYEYRIETGNIPPELARYIETETTKRKPSRSIRPRGRRGGKAFDPTSSEENPWLEEKAEALKKKWKKWSGKKKPSRKNGGKTKTKTANPKNPSVEAHQEIGEKFLSESEKLWEKYRTDGSKKILLDAYRALELAHQEFSYTGDKKGLKQAKAGITAARAEILELID